MKRSDPPGEGSPAVPGDPSVRSTVLGNGLEVWLRPHSLPPGKIVVFLRVDVGSIDERDEERGAAHFLEHMAFHGSRRLPAGELEKRVAAEDTFLGQDHNAFTGLEQTTFFMTFPRGGAGALDCGLLCLSQIASDLLLDAGQLERERSVILEEMRALGGAGRALRSTTQKLLLEGSLWVERPIIGVAETVEGMTPARLRGFYERWYRPENARLALVGDFDPERALERVATYFSHWQRGRVPPTGERRPLPAWPTASRIGLCLHPELGAGSVRRLSLTRRRSQRDLGRLGESYAETLALRCLARRLRRARKKAAWRLGDLEVTSSAWTSGFGVAQIGAATRTRDLPRLGRFLAAEARRASEYPFSPSEVEFARSLLLRRGDERVGKEERAASEDVARRLQSVPLGEPPPPTLAGEWQLGRDLLEALPGEAVAKAFRELFFGHPPAFLVANREPVAGLEKALVEELEAGDRDLLAAPVETEGRAELPVPGPAGRFREVACHEGLGVTSFRAENGVLLHVRPLPKPRDRVWLEISLPGGWIEEDAETRGITQAAWTALSDPCLRDLDPLQIRDLVESHQLRFQHAVEEDRLRLGLGATTKDLEAGLALLCGLLEGVELTAEAEELWRERALRLAAESRRGLETEMARHSVELLTGGDVRFRLPEATQIVGLTRPRIEAWLARLTRETAPEVALVGDFEPRRALDLLETYLGSLSERQPFRSDGSELRQLAVREGPLALRGHYHGNPTRAGVFCGWRTPPWSQATLRRCLYVACEILGQHLHREVRNRRGLTYSARSLFSPSRSYPEGSLLSIAFICDPRRAEEGLGLARSVAESLARKGLDEGEVALAARRFADSARRTQDKPLYWARTLSELRHRPLDLDELAAVPDAYEGLSVDTVSKAFREVVTQSRRLEVVLKPSE